MKTIVSIERSFVNDKGKRIVCSRHVHEQPDDDEKLYRRILDTLAKKDDDDG